jgi:hypothetical protein
MTTYGIYAELKSYSTQVNTCNYLLHIAIGSVYRCKPRSLSAVGANLVLSKPMNMATLDDSFCLLC